MTALNRKADGPFAFADATQMNAWDATKAAIDAVEENNDMNEAKWADWKNSDEILSIYELSSDLTHIGHNIINSAIAGERWQEKMNEWSRRIFEDSRK